MTASFIDVMVIDQDSFGFLWAAFPEIRWGLAIFLILAAPSAVAIWRHDPYRVHRGMASLAAIACLFGLAGLSLAKPFEPGESFGDSNYVSSFARSGIKNVSEFFKDGFMETDRMARVELNLDMSETCQPIAKRPHIILLHDESSFDIRATQGVNVPDGYGSHFQSFDGKARKFLVEGAGGPSWLTEYNVLSGLSSRSYGRFAFFVTRIAARRVERGLPRALRHCGYRTFSLFPVVGAFLGARSYQHGVGVEHFLDANDLGARVFEPDRFFYDKTTNIIAREYPNGPLFVYIYLAANHFP